MTQPRHPQPPPHVRRRSPVPWIVLAVALIAAGVVLVPRLVGEKDAAEPVASAEQDPMLLAVEKCDPARKGLKLSDGNRKLSINRAGIQDKSGIDLETQACAFETLQMPGALSERMQETSAEDGQLQGDWPGFTVTWTNSTAKGLDVTVTRS
jgi:hypothetical protein